MTYEEKRTQIEEHLAEILDGNVPDELYDWIADDDALRDLRYDAERAIELVRAAGSDCVVGSDMELRVLAALDARSQEVREGSTATEALATTEAPSEDTEVALALGPSGTAPPEVQRAPSPVVLKTSTERSKRWLRLAPRHLAVGGGVLGGLLVLTAAAAVCVLFLTRAKPWILPTAGWSGTVSSVTPVGGRGLEQCSEKGQRCKPLAKGDRVGGGTLIKTDERTRVHLDLGDGTRLSLDRATRLVLPRRSDRLARLEAGSIVADVADNRAKRARFELGAGHVEVLGTKFALRADRGAATVDVSRGEVRLVDGEGRAVSVRAGEEGRFSPGEPARVSGMIALGESLAWSEEAETAGEAPVSRGLGELRAKKPGEERERENAVTLTSHTVKVRIAGAVARTEVDETFTNSTADVLEGIYRFPLPPDAKIERLALEVGGKWEEGAFVDRERAQAIWRGAIVNAAPQLKPRMQEEIIWVPGPWRDPALLEWQRGGRFELRIYPIPKHGSRRVLLAYTQTLPPTAGVRRYTYPLAYDPSGSTRVADFRVDLQVRGHDAKVGVRARGYDLGSGDGGAGVASLALARQNFVPSGDLTVEYALPDRDSTLTAWTYQPPSSPAALATGPAVAAGGGAPSPYVALALRPTLPRSESKQRRAYALLVDSSRSMYGENYQRATLLASRMVRELDPEDRFALLACDTVCRALPGGMQAPGERAASDARRFLSGIAPEGASDVAATVRAGVSVLRAETERAVRVMYIGDGTPTVGAIRPAYVARAVEAAMVGRSGMLIALGVGGDSDSETLRAMARGGGGLVVPYTPGQTIGEAAYAALGASYGHALRDVRVHLPEGLGEVAPEKLDTIPAGGESLVLARMTRPEVEGTVVLEGKVGNQPFQERYPVRLVASSAAGNAFVPRLHAAARIADLEQSPDAEAKRRAIELSSAFNVASRYTSLLVLESQAMIKAFGLTNQRTAPEWTGEEEMMEESESDRESEGRAAGGVAVTARAAALRPGLMSGSLDAVHPREAPSARGGWTVKKKSPNRALEPGSEESAAAPARASGPCPPGDLACAVRMRAKSSEGYEYQSADPAAPNPTTASPARPKPAPAPFPLPSTAPVPQSAQPASGAVAAASAWQPPPRPRVWIPMHRVWTRVGEITTERQLPKSVSAEAIVQAERDLGQNENRRGAVKRLYTLYSLSGDLDRARALAERWSEKEPLDPEALTARADLAARMGDRATAIRILGSVVDVRPGDVKAQRRLMRLERWAGNPSLGCAFGLGVAQLVSKDAQVFADATRCARETSAEIQEAELLGQADPTIRKRIQQLLDRPRPDEMMLSGDLRLEASWSRVADLDLALLDADGNRVSWLGAPTRSVITASGVTSTNGEGLGLRGAKPGEYVMEIVRVSGDGPVSGSLKVTAANITRIIPFTLDGSRLVVGIATIRTEPRLVRAW